MKTVIIYSPSCHSKPLFFLSSEEDKRSMEARFCHWIKNKIKKGIVTFVLLNSDFFSRNFNFTSRSSEFFLSISLYNRSILTFFSELWHKLTIASYKVRFVRYNSANISVFISPQNFYNSQLQVYITQFRKEVTFFINFFIFYSVAVVARSENIYLTILRKIVKLISQFWEKVKIKLSIMSIKRYYEINLTLQKYLLFCIQWWKLTSINIFWKKSFLFIQWKSTGYNVMWIFYLNFPKKRRKDIDN